MVDSLPIVSTRPVNIFAILSIDSVDFECEYLQSYRILREDASLLGSHDRVTTSL